MIELVNRDPTLRDRVIPVHVGTDAERKGGLQLAEIVQHHIAAIRASADPDLAVTRDAARRHEQAQHDDPRLQIV